MNAILESTPTADYIWMHKEKDNIWKIAYTKNAEGNWRKCDGIETAEHPEQYMLAQIDHAKSKFRSLDDEEMFIFRL